MSYEVIVTPDEDMWEVSVPAVNRVTMARNLREVDMMASDLIEIMTEEKNPQLDVRIELPDSVQSKLDAMNNYRHQAHELEEQATREQAEAIRSLHESGMPYRDIGTALGISYQRAHQLVNA
jgi:1,6-anhydro-N-acetylmuramate kinase